MRRGDISNVVTTKWSQMTQDRENAVHAGQEEAQKGLIWPHRGQIITHSSGRGREGDTAARSDRELLEICSSPQHHHHHHHKQQQQQQRVIRQLQG